MLIVLATTALVRADPAISTPVAIRCSPAEPILEFITQAASLPEYSAGRIHQGLPMPSIRDWQQTVRRKLGRAIDVEGPLNVLASDGGLRATLMLREAKQPSSLLRSLDFEKKQNEEAMEWQYGDVEASVDGGQLEFSVGTPPAAIWSAPTGLVDPGCTVLAEHGSVKLEGTILLEEEGRVSVRLRATRSGAIAASGSTLSLYTQIPPIALWRASPGSLAWPLLRDHLLPELASAELQRLEELLPPAGVAVAQLDTPNRDWAVVLTFAAERSRRRVRRILARAWRKAGARKTKEEGAVVSFEGSGHRWFVDFDTDRLVFATQRSIHEDLIAGRGTAWSDVAGLPADGPGTIWLDRRDWFRTGRPFGLRLEAIEAPEGGLTYATDGTTDATWLPNIVAVGIRYLGQSAVESDLSWRRGLLRRLYAAEVKHFEDHGTFVPMQAGAPPDALREYIGAASLDEGFEVDLWPKHKGFTIRHTGPFGMVSLEYGQSIQKEDFQ